MATETRHSGTLRTDYEADRARLDGFPALTADTDRLLRRLIRASREIPYRDEDGREGTLTPLVENHVLTVLADIRRKRLAGYGESFAGAQGTSRQSHYARKLEHDIRDWAVRLEAYLQGMLSTGGLDSPSTSVVRELLDRLTDTLQTPTDEDNRRYYRMLRTVTAIQENADRYWQQVADSGDTDPAIALLIAHVENYAGIAEAFNRKFATLPELYSREVLHATPREAMPDNAYLVVTPSRDGFTLEAGTAFAADEELAYKTTRKEYISPMRLASAQALYKDRDGLHLQTLDFGNTATAETLFTDGKDMQTGWQIESPMLVLEEGRREVAVRFLLKPGEGLPTDGRQQGFTLQYATAEGWTDALAECELSSNELTFNFIIARDGIAPVPCTTEQHGAETAYPAIRILTTNSPYPAWAEDLAFEEIRIETHVSGIRDFTFLSDLGEADTTQPFAPFGMQAERGAWFIFGNGETGLKPLKEVRLEGTWQKLPETRSKFDELYKDYKDYTDGVVDASAFRIRTEYQKDGQWHKCSGESVPLFAFDGQGHFGQASIGILFPCKEPHTKGDDSERDEYARDKDGFFRATLDSPAIGFGQSAYRRLFAEVMMHNGRCKGKDLWALPQEPPVPLLADVELSYKAETSLPTGSLTPIAQAENREAPPREGLGRLLPIYSTPCRLCLALANATGEQRLRLYFDMTLPQDKLPYYRSGTDAAAPLVWQYWGGTDWTDIAAKDITADETAGLTQSGFVEIDLPGLKERHTDQQGRLWLRAMVTNDVSACLALRGVWTNCIRVVADGGDGTPLPAGTIQDTIEENLCIGNVTQPLPGFGGTPAGTEAQAAAYQTSRFANRHRAVTQRDYEQILLEHYPEADYARCFTLQKKQGVREKPEIRLVVFSRAEDSRYFLSPPWKLREMERTLRQYASSHVNLQVTNPIYEAVAVKCEATLHFGVQDTGKVLDNLTTIVERYFQPWQKDGGFPIPGLIFSAKELCSRLVNHEDLQRVTLLEINGRAYTEDTPDGEDVIKGSEPGSILLPKVEIMLSAPDDGIGGNGIGSDFVVG